MGVFRTWLFGGLGIGHRAYNEKQKERRKIQKYAKRAERLRAGICRDCSNKTDGWHALCEEHRTKRKMVNNERRAKGLCIHCGRQPSVSNKGAGKNLCRRCARERSWGYYKKRRLGRVAPVSTAAKTTKGLCIVCGERTNGWHLKCTECRIKHSSTRRERKKAGLCTDCGLVKPKDGASVCGSCLSIRGSHYHYAVVKRVCKECKSAECPPRKHYCPSCGAKKAVEGARKHRNHRKAQKAKVYAAYGNACAACGENREVLLQIDHVNNDGNKEPKNAKGKRRSVPYSRIIKEGFPGRYQILCIACNLRKYGETLLT